MAAPPPLDVRVETTDEEMSSTEEIGSTSENGGNPERDSTKTEPDAEEQFKKPALFKAPSLPSKRGHVAVSSKPTAAETKPVEENNGVEVAEITTNASPASPAVEKETAEKRKEEDENGGEDKSVSSVRNKPEAKPRVLPVRGPPLPGKFPPLGYTEPQWGGSAADMPYALEILKNGTIVDTVPLTHASFFVVGRLPVCDVSLEHPSISRYHAVIQFRAQAGEGGGVGEERGFYVHDLGSTHGTVVNKSKIPPNTYVRLRVGHMLKFGGSTRLFILQGPEFDEEEESELTVTELREKARKQKEELEKMMLGDGSDDDDDDDEKEKEGEGDSIKSKKKSSKEDSGCSWGIDEEVVPEEDEDEENPFSTEFQEDQEAAYLKDPKKALQGFYDREGEELEFEYEDKSHGSWLCRIKLPVDDAKGRQLVAEATVTGKKKDAVIQCCLEACRMLEARGLLRQEAVSRKRKKKNWEDEDYYDSDDDTFLDRTGTVERKRKDRMKKAGKIAERAETFESLVVKLSGVEKELEDTQKKLNAGRGDSSGSSTGDTLDAFMTAVRTETAMDAVERRKLHVHVADLRKDAQRLRKLVELTRPAQMPSLLPSGSSELEKPKKTLPLFGAMKGGSKYKLKTGTIGKLPPKRPNLPVELFNMKELAPTGEEEEEEEVEGAVKNEDNDNEQCASISESNDESEESSPSMSRESSSSRKQRGKPAQSNELREQSHKQKGGGGGAEAVEQSSKSPAESSPKSRAEGDRDPATDPGARKKKKGKGPGRPPVELSGEYPDDDPDYSVWMPPSDQTGDGRTHLNDKYGY